MIAMTAKIVPNNLSNLRKQIQTLQLKASQLASCLPSAAHTDGIAKRLKTCASTVRTTERVLGLARLASGCSEVTPSKSMI